MSVENKAAVLHGAYDLRVQSWPIPEINDNELLIRVECVGVCGTDVKTYTTAISAYEALTKPIVMGHEGAGVVVKVGKNVRTHAVGDRVAIEPAQPCRSCDYCKVGRYNLCENARYCSADGNDGNLSVYYKHVADFCHKIPDNVSMEEAAAVQPLSVALYACRRAGVALGMRVAILGAGPIGVLCAMTARAMGAASVLLTDLLPERLEIGKRLAADHTLLVKDMSDEQVVDGIQKLLGRRPEVTIDACGADSAQRVALNVTKTGGTVLVVGIGNDKVTVPLSPTLLREVDIKGVIRINNTYTAALEMVSSGAIDLKSFITHRFPLDKVTEALQTATNRIGMKTVVYVQQ